MTRRIIHSEHAPKAIGTYSQAVQTSGAVYFSGQIPIDPETGHMVEGDFASQIDQVMRNLAAVALEAGGSLSEMVKVNVYLTDLGNFPAVNAAMERHFEAPYPARAVIGVAALPLAAQVEMDAIMVVNPTEEYHY